MDEILIGEKKYVSSKQAAKVTGYAKDYIGQLCREGRVPARLVGRSWYVLESAIYDHRFGDPKPEHVQKSDRVDSELLPTWESPRYEATTPDALPSVNILKEEMPEKDSFVAPLPLQDSWKAWFDRVPAEPAPGVPLVTHKVEMQREYAAAEPDADTKEVEIPIHARHSPQQQYQPLPHELMPQRGSERRTEFMATEEQSDEEEATPKAMGKFYSAVKVAGLLVALIVASFAIMGTGYFDGYLTANKSAGLIAGVAVYNK